MECKDIDTLIGEIRKKVVKGSKPTRTRRLKSCLRVLDPQQASDVGKSMLEADDIKQRFAAAAAKWKEKKLSSKPGSASSSSKPGHSTSHAVAVAGTIMKQIKAGLGAIDYLAMGLKNVLAIGADTKVTGSRGTGPGVQFDARGHWKGRVIVRLAPNDTYTLTFGRIRGSSWKIDKEVDGIYADVVGKVVRDNVLRTGIKENTETNMNLGDAISRFRSTSLGEAIARFRSLDEANMPAPAVNRATPGGKQLSSKSNFGNGGANKRYDGKAASVPSDKEAMAAATNATAGVSGPGYNGSGREKIDVRSEHHWGNDESGDVLFAEEMMADKIGHMRSFSARQPLNEENKSAPAVSRETPAGKQKSSKSRFRQPPKGKTKRWDGQDASIPADKEAMAAAANSTAGVDGDGYDADGREEIDVRGE